MKILVLVGNYDPKPDANGACIKAIIDQLERKKNEVYTICLGYFDEQNDFDPNPKIYHILTNRPAALREMRGIRKLLYLIKRVFILPLWPMIRPEIMVRYYDLGIKLHAIHNFEAVISVQNPIETVEAAYKIKKEYPKIKFGVYTMDPVTNSYKNIDSPILKYLSRRWEEKIYCEANSIFHLECHRNHYTQKKYDKYRCIINFLDVPLFQIEKFKRYEGVSVKSSTNVIKLIYSGAFYHRLREPFYLLNCFKAIIEQTENVEIHFYSSGPFEKLINEEAKRSNGKIKAHGYVDPKSLDIAIHESDVLLSVGNAITEMVPSKIFMYMSTGKPIIHFYDNEQDACIKYFKKYPLSLLIYQKNSYANNIEVINLFLKNNLKKMVDARLLKEVLSNNTPEYSASQIVEKLLKL